MNDIERLKEWMKERDLSVWDLAREMGLARHTVYFVVERRKNITETFAKRFVEHYGWDVASKIFVEHYSHLLNVIGTPA